MDAVPVKKLTPRKSRLLFFSGAYSFFLIPLLLVIIFGAFLLVRQDSVCRELTPSSHPYSNESAWGMICQIHREETNRTPRLLVDIQNAGKLTFMGYKSTEAGFAICVDGKWHRWFGGTDVKSSLFDPGSVYHTSVDLSDRNWGIDLLSGDHSVQVAIWLEELSSRRCIWIASNIVPANFAGR
jgi:hypothetical protein